MEKLVVDTATGIVENIIIADDDFFLVDKVLITYLGQAKIGDVYEGGVFISKITQEVLSTTEQIQALESSVTPRRIREAILGIDNGWMIDLNAQIEELRKGM